jgi:hypothetical protein
MIGAHRRVADKSFRSPGHPNYRMLELYNDRVRQDKVRLERSKDQSPEGLSGININYNPTYHINAGSMDDLKRHLAAEHRQAHRGTEKRSCRNCLAESARKFCQF